MSSSEDSAKVVSPGANGFWSPGRIVFSLIVVGLVAAFGLSSCNSNDQPGSTASSGTGSAPPARNNKSTVASTLSLPHTIRDAQLKTLDGESLKLSDYADKVVVVNIWATWCPPCNLEIPDLIKLNREYKAKGLVVIGLATTYNESNDIQHVKDFVRAKNIDYKIIWDDGTLTQPLVQMVHGPNSIPQSFVISRDGRILKHFPGYSETQTPVLMRQAVEDALSDKG